ncbi:hypothetical protein LIER_07212 [Lithospermum erythrorhizon]|uniref:Uncharacterized protein n=1 Tax=Lithospermum erythrorhizon TaxID=34254 RepID=A0AAV3P7F8_LITER
MSTSRLVTKKRRSNDDQEDNLSTQRSIRRIRTSTIIRPGKIPDLNLSYKTGKIRTPDFPPPEAENVDADCELFRELKTGRWPDSESCMWLSSGSGGSSSPPSLLDDQRFDPLLNVEMSAWKRLLFVLMLLASSKSGFQGKSSVNNGFSQGTVKEDKFDIDKCGSYGSLVNLEEENSDWGSGTDTDVDFLQPDFPSNSYKRSTIVLNNELNKRTSGVVAATDLFQFDEDVGMKGFNHMDDVDEPLFWPSGLKSAWFSDPGSNFFVMSPPKKKLKAESPEKIEVVNADLSKVEEVDLDEVSDDEPLVWPSDHKFDWSPEVAWNFFNMSPSKKKREEIENQNKLEYFRVDKNSTKTMVDLEDFNQDELLVWPSDQKHDWNSEAVFNLFIMSPLKRRQNREAGLYFSREEPLFWPSDSAFDWDHEAARNFFAMSPRRGKKISFESSIKTEVGVKASRKRNRGIGGVIVSPRVVELRKGSTGSKSVVRTKSMPANMRKRSSFARKEGIL